MSQLISNDIKDFHLFLIAALNCLMLIYVCFICCIILSITGQISYAILNVFNCVNAIQLCKESQNSLLSSH